LELKHSDIDKTVFTDTIIEPFSRSTLNIINKIKLLQDTEFSDIHLELLFPNSIRSVSEYNGNSNELIIKTTTGDYYGVFFTKDNVFNKDDVSYRGNRLVIKLGENVKINSGTYSDNVKVKKFGRINSRDIDLYFSSFELETKHFFKISSYVESNDIKESYDINKLEKEINNLINENKIIIIFYDLSWYNVLKDLGIKFSVEKYKNNYYFKIYNYESTLYEDDNVKLSYIINRGNSKIIIAPRFLINDKNFLKELEKVINQ
jgi:hypothetical protein